MGFTPVQRRNRPTPPTIEKNTTLRKKTCLLPPISLVCSYSIHHPIRPSHPRLTPSLANAPPSLAIMPLPLGPLAATLSVTPLPAASPQRPSCSRRTLPTTAVALSVPRMRAAPHHSHPPRSHCRSRPCAPSLVSALTSPPSRIPRLNDPTHRCATPALTYEPHSPLQPPLAQHLRADPPLASTPPSPLPHLCCHALRICTAIALPLASTLTSPSRMEGRQ